MREVRINLLTQQQKASLSFVGSRILLSAPSEDEEKKEEEEEVMDIEVPSLPFGEAFKGYTDPDVESNLVGMA
eukprot:12355077-Ditylum_brightwellii.AAC.1